MIGAQESKENVFHTFDSLSEEVKKTILDTLCLNCDQHLEKNTKIHYVTLSKKVLWWHDRSCSKERFTN